MMKLRSLSLAGTFAAALFISPAHAQVGQPGPGQVMGNATASQARAQPVSLSAVFNQGFCSTPGAMLTNIAGTWGCISQVALTQLPTLGANTVLGSIAGGTPIALSKTQLTTLCNLFSTSLSGCVASPGSVTGKVLGDDGNWHTQPGTGTMTSLTAGQGCVSGTTGQTAITTSGTINCPTGSSNKLRNSSLTSWFHGSGSLTITTAGGWCLEGIYVVPTGASITCARATSFGQTFYSQQIIGNTSVTDVTVRFVIESLDAAPLAGQQVTCQFNVFNGTGGSITPTFTIKRAASQDSTYTNTDVNAASLQTISNGTSGILAYSWPANASSSNGLSVDIDFGNNFSSNAKSITVGGGFDCHVTPGVSTGTVANPPSAEIRTASDDNAWNKRFFRASYENGTTPGAATHNGMVFAGQNDATTAGAGTISFETPMRATPSISSWDGAGNSGKLSTITGASTTFTDNVAATTGPFGASTAGFFANGNNTTAHAIGLLHYTADATLTGG